MDQEKILLSIQFNDSDINKSVENIAKARTAIDNLIAQNKKLVDQGQKNSKSYIENQESIKALNAEVAQNSKIVQANSQAVQNNVVNIDALKKANKELLIERNKVDVTTEAGRKQIQELNDQYDKNSQIIADNSTKVEKQRFNIGNYQSALSNVSPALGQFAGNLGQATQASGGLTQGIFSMVKASLAFIATPIGAIIAALVVAFKALQTFISGSTEGMDKFEQVTAGVSAVVDVAVDRVVSLVSAIGKLLSGDFEGGLNGIKDSFAGIGDEILREVGAAVELQKAIQALEDREIDYEVAASETENTIKRLIIESKNRSLTEEQRAKKLEEALELEKTQNEELNAIKEEALRIANEQAAQNNEVAKALELTGGATRQASESEAEYAKRIIATGKAIDSLRDPIVDALKARNTAEGESLAFQEKIQNQADALAEKAEAKREKLAADAEKRAEKERERLEKLAEKQKEIDDRNLKAANELEIFLLTQDAKRLTNAKATADALVEIEYVKSQQILANEELTETERQLILETSQATINQIRTEQYEKQKEEAAIQFEEELEGYSEFVQGLINEKKEQLLQDKISQEEYDQEIADLEIAAMETELAIKAQFGERDLAQEGALTDAKIAQKQYEADTTNRIEQSKVQAVQSTLGQIAGLFNKNSIAFKALATAQTLIQTYQSAQAVFTGMTTSIPGPVGIALGVAGAAAAIASGLANVAKINSTKTPKLEDGGMISIGGNRHSAGGEDVHVGGRLVANVEQGEKMVVLNRKAAQSPLLRNLSAINKMSGGTDFYSDRSPKRHLVDGGFVARSASSPVNSFQNLSLAEAMKKVTIYTQTTELERVQKNALKATFTSELS